MQQTRRSQLNLPDAVSMLAHRLRRWLNIETELCECPVFAKRDANVIGYFIGDYQFR